MKGYESSLFPLLQELYSKIKDNNLSWSSAYPTINHLQTFIGDLNKDNSELGYSVAINKALKSSNNCGQCTNCKKCTTFFYLAIAELKLSNFPSTQFAEHKRQLEKDYGPLSFRNPPQYLKPHLVSQVNIQRIYQDNIQKQKFLRNISDNLIVLKGMSSSSPYILNGIYGAKHFTGGGIYLRFDDYGVVIDPGYGFVENMREYGISIKDIDAVIITHYHIDHTNDMRIIDDLNHQFQQEKHIIHWFMDEKTFGLLFCEFDSKINSHTIIKSSSFNIETKINNSISFVPFKTEHIIEEDDDGRSFYNEQTFGLVLKLSHGKDKKEKIQIGYTSDTRYFDGLETHLEGCNIIIANISGIYYADYLLTYQKDRHLGYRGCYYLLQRLTKSPELFIISEFWNGTSDLRVDVCKALTEETTPDTKIIPGDIGLHVNVKELKIKCSQCGSYHNICDLHTVKPSEDFASLLYVCKNCLL